MSLSTLKIPTEPMKTMLDYLGCLERKKLREQGLPYKYTTQNPAIKIMLSIEFLEEENKLCIGMRPAENQQKFLAWYEERLDYQFEKFCNVSNKPKESQKTIENSIYVDAAIMDLIELLKNPNLTIGIFSICMRGSNQETNARFAEKFAAEYLKKVSHKIDVKIVRLFFSNSVDQFLPILNLLKMENLKALDLLNHNDRHEKLNIDSLITMEFWKTLDVFIQLNNFESDLKQFSHLERFDISMKTIQSEKIFEIISMFQKNSRLISVSIYVLDFDPTLLEKCFGEPTDDAYYTAIPETEYYLRVQVNGFFLDFRRAVRENPENVSTLNSAERAEQNNNNDNQKKKALLPTPRNMTAVYNILNRIRSNQTLDHAAFELFFYGKKQQFTKYHSYDWQSVSALPKSNRIDVLKISLIMDDKRYLNEIDLEIRIGAKSTKLKYQQVYNTHCNIYGEKIWKHEMTPVLERVTADLKILLSNPELKIKQFEYHDSFKCETRSPFQKSFLTKFCEIFSDGLKLHVTSLNMDMNEGQAAFKSLIDCMKPGVLKTLQIYSSPEFISQFYTIDINQLYETEVWHKLEKFTSSYTFTLSIESLYHMENVGVVPENLNERTLFALLKAFGYQKINKLELYLHKNFQIDWKVFRQLVQNHGRFVAGKWIFEDEVLKDTIEMSFEPGVITIERKRRLKKVRF